MMSLIAMAREWSIGGRVQLSLALLSQTAYG
jgi:hypothetical protein